MLRWLLLPLGLAMAAAAAWLLLAAPDGSPSLEASRGGDSTGAAPSTSGVGKPMGEIDDASRRKLEDVLEREGIAP